MTINSISDLTSFKWATVRGTDPLSIQLDGDPAPLALIPDTLVDPRELSVGNRVRVELTMRKVVIHGRSNGGTASGTTAQRNARFGVPATLSERVALANRQVVWFNTLLGWEESYYVPVATVGLTVRGLTTTSEAPAGWYPTGLGPRLLLATSGVQNMTAGDTFTNWATPGVGRSYSTGPLGFVDYGAPGYAYTRLAGRYETMLALYLTNGTTTPVFSLRANHTPTTGAQIQQKPTPLLQNFGQVFEWHMRDLEMKTNGLFFARCDGGSVAAGEGWSELSVKYLGPPLTQTPQV